MYSAFWIFHGATGHTPTPASNQNYMAWMNIVGLGWSWKLSWIIGTWTEWDIRAEISKNIELKMDIMASGISSITASLEGQSTTRRQILNVSPVMSRSSSPHSPPLLGQRRFITPVKIKPIIPPIRKIILLPFTPSIQTVLCVDIKTFGSLIKPSRISRNSQ